MTSTIKSLSGLLLLSLVFFGSFSEASITDMYRYRNLFDDSDQDGPKTECEIFEADKGQSFDTLEAQVIQSPHEYCNDLFVEQTYTFTAQTVNFIKIQFSSKTAIEEEADFLQIQWLENGASVTKKFACGEVHDFVVKGNTFQLTFSSNDETTMYGYNFTATPAETVDLKDFPDNDSDPCGGFGETDGDNDDIDEAALERLLFRVYPSSNFITLKKNTSLRVVFDDPDTDAVLSKVTYTGSTKDDADLVENWDLENSSIFTINAEDVIEGESYSFTFVSKNDAGSYTQKVSLQANRLPTGTAPTLKSSTGKALGDYVFAFGQWTTTAPGTLKLIILSGETSFLNLAGETEVTAWFSEGDKDNNYERKAGWRVVDSLGDYKEGELTVTVEPFSPGAGEDLGSITDDLAGDDTLDATQKSARVSLIAEIAFAAPDADSDDTDSLISDAEKESIMETLTSALKDSATSATTDTEFKAIAESTASLASNVEYVNADSLESSRDTIDALITASAGAGAEEISEETAGVMVEAISSIVGASEGVYSEDAEDKQEALEQVDTIFDNLTDAILKNVDPNSAKAVQTLVSPKITATLARMKPDQMRPVCSDGSNSGSACTTFPTETTNGCTSATNTIDAVVSDKSYNTYSAGSSSQTVGSLSKDISMKCGDTAAGTSTTLTIEDLSENIVFTVKVDAAEFENPDIAHCQFWDEGAEKWSTTGCTSSKLTATLIQCSCNHLTTFSGSFEEDTTDPDTTDPDTTDPDTSGAESLLKAVSALAISLLMLLF